MPLDFDDPNLTNNDYNPKFGAERPDGYPCSHSDECDSGHCADGKLCAPRNGTGKGGAYCHHGSHCASGECSCPEGNGWVGARGFCKDWQSYTPTHHGKCERALKNGQHCSMTLGVWWSYKCESDHCADGKICAPKNDTGKEGAYCHHDNHCASGLCQCPDGWEQGTKGFCKGWQNFTTAKHGTCSAQSKNGEYCTKDAQCLSRHCANDKCAPINFKGKEGEYCHHDDHCAKSLYCRCPNNNARESWLWPWNQFCAGYRNFNPTDFRGVCTKR